MVDAIGGVSSSQIKPAKKDDAINWKGCTSSEIIEYEEEGQEIPDYILQWAKEFAKLQNAPEDVTYEMAMGATTMAGVNANQETQQGENENSEEETNSAAAIREQMNTEGVSLRTQAKTFRSYSSQYTDEIKNMMDMMEQYLAESEAAQANAQSTKDDVMSRIQSLLASKKDNKLGGVQGAVEAARIDREVKSVGQAGLTSIETAAMPIENTATNISTAEFTSLTGRQFGTETVSIGNELRQTSHWFNQILGSVTVKTGEKELKQSDAGDKQFSEDGASNDEYSKNVSGYKVEVANASGATISNEKEDSDTKEADEKTEGDKTVGDSERDETAKLDETKQKELAQQEPESVDDKITTDPNEILKRKQKKGLA